MSDANFEARPGKRYSVSLMSDADFEAKSYYHGLPSKPISVYHTGALWKRPTGPEAQRVPKEARPICDHPIADVWDRLGPQVFQYLDSVDVKWTTIDVTRFAEVGKDAGPVFIWVGVKPESLSSENAEVAAVGCKKLVERFGINDVEIAFRESLFTRSTGPRLFDYVSSLHATADVRSPLTPALGLQIAARATPHLEGTGGIYIREGNRVFVLTARHVVIPPNAEPNELYSRRNVSQPRRDVLLLGNQAFQDELGSITVGIERRAILVDHYREELRGLGRAEAEERKTFNDKLREAEAAIATLNEFRREVTTRWSAEGQRVLGHVALSPPISVGAGPKHYTEDWALIELDREKIDWRVFKGNVIDLGTFQSISPRSSSPTIIYRDYDFGRRLYVEDVPPPHGSHLL